MKTIEIEETLPTGEVVIRIAVIPDEYCENDHSAQESLEEEGFDSLNRIIVWEM